LIVSSSLAVITAEPSWLKRAALTSPVWPLSRATWAIRREVKAGTALSDQLPRGKVVGIALAERAGGGDQGSVARERDRVDLAGIALADLAPDGALEPAGVGVLHTDRLVIARRDELAPVAGEDETPDESHVPFGVELEIRPFSRPDWSRQRQKRQ
jgi:hypothetical protein